MDEILTIVPDFQQLFLNFIFAIIFCICKLLLEVLLGLILDAVKGFVLLIVQVFRNLAQIVSSITHCFVKLVSFGGIHLLLLLQLKQHLVEMELMLLTYD